MKLSAHAVAQRKAELVARLDDLGDVTAEDSGLGGQARDVRIVATAPGLDLPPLATFDYREVFVRAPGGLWELAVYSYEYREVVVGGRRAYHLHDGRFHAHCIDAERPGRDHHYRAPEIDVHEAHEEFARLYLAGTPVSCEDLRPALCARAEGGTGLKVDPN